MKNKSSVSEEKFDIFVANKYVRLVLYVVLFTQIIMKVYYLAEEDKQKGPYTLEELSKMPLVATTLVWKKGMDDWEQAKNIAELKEIIIPSPPPLLIPNSNNDGALPAKGAMNKEPRKHIYVTVVASILLIPYWIYVENEGIGGFGYAFTALRVFGSIWVIIIARKQNRSKIGWGILAFFLPLLTLMVIGLLRKTSKKHD